MNLKVCGGILLLGCVFLSTGAKTVCGVFATPFGELRLTFQIFGWKPYFGPFFKQGKILLAKISYLLFFFNFGQESLKNYFLAKMSFF